jgi:CrcB protein
MTPWLAVFLGAGLGGALRHGVNLTAARMFGFGFPFGTLTVNIVGCFAMGVLVEVFARVYAPGQVVRLFLTTGVLGGFTTFSAFSLDAAVLFERGTPLTAAVYVALSVGASLAAVAAGLLFVRHLL